MIDIQGQVPGADYRFRAQVEAMPFLVHWRGELIRRFGFVLASILISEIRGLSLRTYGGRENSCAVSAPWNQLEGKGSLILVLSTGHSVR